MVWPASDSFPDIRSAIDVSLDTTSLPDAIIAGVVYLGAAQAELTRRVPDWETLTGDNLVRAQRAGIFLTAALLVTAIPVLTAERSPDGQSYSRTAGNPDRIAATLRARADAEIAVLLGEDVGTASRPTVFSVACGRRGR